MEACRCRPADPCRPAWLACVGPVTSGSGNERERTDGTRSLDDAMTPAVALVQSVPFRAKQRSGGQTAGVCVGLRLAPAMEVAREAAAACCCVGRREIWPPTAGACMAGRPWKWRPRASSGLPLPD